MSRFDATGQVPVDKWTAAPRLTTSPQAKHNNRSGQLICDATVTIQGGRERGLILHKLIEEVLSGETAETMPALVARAEALVLVLGPSLPTSLRHQQPLEFL